MSRMTIRVSRDSGRTWTRERTVKGGGLPPVWVPCPPCACPRCTESTAPDPALDSVRAALERDLTPCSDCGQMPCLEVTTTPVAGDYPPIISVTRRCACPSRKYPTEEPTDG
ncbi:hypothetical protein [Streptomyces albus]|uniref:hypothetical protein n=1 Tax=Streptomyces albus TaxID=1888 RepID=UPI003454AA1A